MASRRGESWGVPDLVDLEYFLSLDAEAEESRLARRDREIYRDLSGTVAAARSGVLRGWLERRRLEARSEAMPLPGEVVGTLLKTIPSLLLVFAVLAGVALAWGVLSYAGDRPINLFAALALLVALPSVFAMLSAVLPLWRLVRRGTPAGALGGWLTGILLPRLGRRAFALLAPGARERLAATGGLLRGRGGLYAGLLGWLAFAWLQLAALGFSLAVLLTVLLRGWTADLAFSWQSTARLSPEQVHAFAVALARPWAALADPPLSHPTLEQVAGSRVYLKEGLGQLASADLQSWWYFLLWAILVYAVVPRLLLLGAALAGGGRARRRLAFADARCEALLRRMRQPQMATGREGEERTEAPPPPPWPAEAEGGLQRLHALIPAELTSGGEGERWRRQIEKEFAAAVAEPDPVQLDEVEDEPLLQGLAGEAGGTPVLLVLEGWQPCLTATLEYLRVLRRRLGRERLLVVALVGRGEGEERVATPAAEFAIWRQRLAALGDPWLLVHNWGRGAGD